MTRDTVADICAKYNTSTKTYYKWKNRYLKYGIEGLKDRSRKPHNIQPVKVTNDIEQQILDLRITKRFGCNRIRFRFKRLKEISLSTRTTINVIKKDPERQILIKKVIPKDLKQFLQAFLT